MEDRISALEERIKILEKDSNDIIINIIKNGNVHKKVVFHTFDESKIKKHFNAVSLFKCFTKENKNLYGGYYKCGITGGVHLVLSDTQEKLEEDIIQIGMDE